MLGTLLGSLVDHLDTSTEEKMYRNIEEHKLSDAFK